MVLATAMLDLGVVAFLLSKAGFQTKYLVTGWLGANFILYRLALSWSSPGKLCPCLGTITETLGISDADANRVLTAVAWYLLIGAIACYAQQRKDPLFPLSAPRAELEQNARV
jgi:hypothetical protein